MSNPKTRFYPMCCQSMYCGETACPASCPNLPILRDFQEWKRRTKAVQPDPIWSPTAYQATV